MGTWTKIYDPSRYTGAHTITIPTSDVAGTYVTATPFDDNFGNSII